MGSIFQSQFVGNEFQPAVGADIPRPDNNFGLFEPAPLSEIDTSPIDLFAPGNINRLVLTSDPVSPTSNTSRAGASAPLDLFEIDGAGSVESINAGTTTPGAMFDMARDAFGTLTGFQGPVLGAMELMASPFGQEARGTTRGFGRFTQGLGLLGVPVIGPPLGAFQIGRGLFDVVEAFVPGIRQDINNLTFQNFGFDLFGQQRAIEQAFLEDPFSQADFSGFGTPGFDDPAGLDLGAFSDLSAADFDPGFDFDAAQESADLGGISDPTGADDADSGSGGAGDGPGEGGDDDF